MFTEEITNVVDMGKSIGLPLPDYTKELLIAIVLLWIFLSVIKAFGTFLLKCFKSAKSYFDKEETKAFVERRADIISLLKYEVISLNKQSEWYDFNYTELKAEVEVDQSFNLNPFHSINPIVWITYLFELIKNSFGLNPSEKIEESLVKAIIKSKSGSFIVIGDPGSGKTVSLRHLFLKMADDAEKSKNNDAIIPLYLNLKHLDIDVEALSVDNFEKWIINQIECMDNRTVREFMNKYFNKMLEEGSIFFLFDSFDEIPSVMDAQEENEIVYKYSQMIDRFLHSYPNCRGLVSSRPYRSPKRFDGQKITILSLPEDRIKKALKQFLKQEPKLADKLWLELTNRRELLSIIQNPFYLGLLAQYCKENNKLPDRIYDLFESFIVNRAETDKERLSRFDFSPEQLIRDAETLAYSMTKNGVGLEASINEIKEITLDLYTHRGWDCDKIESLIDALSYSKLGKKARDVDANSKTFGFVHRRFHEFFCARYLRNEFQDAPFEQLNVDNRWREVLVLLCEVLPINKLNEVFEISLESIQNGIDADSNTELHKKALESVLFLKDGFKSRIEDLPLNLRIGCSNFIKQQFESKNLLNQKRALEALIVVNDGSASDIIKSAFEQKSGWLAETAIKSCRVLKNIPTEIEIEIQRYLYKQYSEMRAYQCYVNYNVFFSSSASLKSLQTFLQRLTIINFEQILFISLIIFYIVAYNLQLFIAFIFSIILFFSVRFVDILLKDSSVVQGKNPFFSQYPLLNSSMRVFLKDKSNSVDLISNPFVVFSITWMFSFVLLNSSFFFNLFFTIAPGIQYNSAKFELDYYTLGLSIVLLMINLPLASINTPNGKIRRIHLFFFFLPIFVFVAPFFESEISSLIVLLNQGIFIKISGILFALISIIILLISILAVFGLIKVTLFDILKEFISSWINHELTFSIAQKLIACVWFWWSIIAFLICYNLIINFDYSTIFNLDFNYIQNNLTSSRLFLKYGSIIPWFFILTSFINIFLVLLISIYFVAAWNYIFSKSSLNLVSDQITLRKLISQLKNNKVSTNKALELLNCLKTETTKAQYVRLLLKYLPVEKDTTLLIYEANRNKGDVRDLLFQLAESWENSTNDKIY